MNSVRDIAWGGGHRGQGSTISRRGNALVLVAGALVLLVIIASAYLSSAQGIRKTSMAQRRAVNVDAAAGVVAEDIAKEISDALFVREIDTTAVETDLGTTSILNRLLDTNSSLGGEFSQRFLEDRRLPLSSVSYFQEMGREQQRYEVDRNFAWNFAPFEVVPKTNWPDYGTAWHGYDEETGLWSGVFQPGIGLDNAPGQPGTSDTRWLRDLEPLRASTTDYLGATMGLDPTSNQDTFSHYGHLTNLARPGNDWRICRDIADVTGELSPEHDALDLTQILTPVLPFDPAEAGPDGFHYFGGIQRDHHVPVEQWLSLAPTINGGNLHRSTYSGTTYFSSPVDFWRRWQRWFDYAGYAYAQAESANGNSDFVPPNFYDLSNLDADTRLDGNGGGEVLGSLSDFELSGDAIGERPEDEFIRGSARWHVSRILTDTDGDGFTDSFWFHVPGRGSEGTMQVVGVSVTDNAGRLNANTATRFVRSDSRSGSRTRTRGWTPADLALVGQNAEWSPGDGNSGWDHGDAGWGPSTHETWNVGFLDNPANSPGLFDIESATGMPPSTYELLGHYRQGLDAIDKTVQEQNTDGEQARSEVFPIWKPNYYRDGLMGDFLSETSVQFNRWFPESNDIHRGANRLFYFNKAGGDPQNPMMSFTPFTISDEIELRTNEGNNQPWLMTRFERAIGPSQDDNGNYYSHPLRSFSHRQEHAELVDQLSARQLFFDNRRKLTLFNGSRNEQLPPWLWWEYRGSRLTSFDPSGAVIPTTSVHGVPLSPPADYAGVVGPPVNKINPQGPVNLDFLDEDWSRVVPDRPDRPASFGSVRNAPNTRLSQFYDQMRQKLDLREHEQLIPYRAILLGTEDYRPRTFSERLPYSLFLALQSGDMSPVSSFQLGTSRNPFDDQTETTDDIVSKNLTREMAASYAANILAWRDPDSDAPLYSQTVLTAAGPHREYGPVRPPVFLDDLDVPPPSQNEPDPELVSQNGADEPAFLGMEMQPFILETFVAHVVEPWSPNIQKEIGGKRYKWDSGNPKQFQDEFERLFIEYRDGDEDLVQFSKNENESRSMISDGEDGLKESKSVVAVQIANPYDRPLPLFGRNPISGLLDRTLPLYKISFFGQEVVVDDSLVQLSEEGYSSAYTAGYTYNNGTEPWNLEPSQVSGRTPRLPLFLPPATAEEPYSLILFATGYGAGDVEDRRWIDFLDLNPEDHFYGNWVNGGTPQPDIFTLARDLDGNGAAEHVEVKAEDSANDEPIDDGLLRIYPGDLICRVPDSVWKTDRTYYDDESGMQDDVAVKLIRTHRRDYDGDKNFTGVFDSGPGQKYHEYEIDVVIDRTGIASASGESPFEDEFFETVTETLEYERLPNLEEFVELTGVTEEGGFDTDPNQALETEPRTSAIRDRLAGSDYGIIKGKLASMPADGRCFQFDTRVPVDVHDPTGETLQSSIDSVRWCQWARYSRAWGVDPGYPGVERPVAVGAFDVPLNTYMVPAPIVHMNRRAPRYVLGDAQVTRSKGRPLVSGDVIEPRDSEALLTPFYNGMEQVPGAVTSKVGEPLGEILVMNADHRTSTGSGNNKTRYMFESLDGQVTNSLDFRPAWGNVFDLAADPDGSFGDSLDGNPPSSLDGDADRHWTRSPWMTRSYRLPYARGNINQEQQWYFASRKPVFFDMNRDPYQGHPSFEYVGSSGTDSTFVPNLPDKGYYGYNGIEGRQESMPYGFQMLQKDGNFEQVGEVLNVMVWGHELLMPAGPPTPTTTVSTTRTFSESLAGLALEGNPDFDYELDAPIIGRGTSSNSELIYRFPGDNRHLGRLSVDPSQAVAFEGHAVGKVQNDTAWPHSSGWLSDVGHVAPDLTPGQRVVELFVCDGPGNWDVYHAAQDAIGFSDGIIDSPEQAASLLGYDPSFGNARDFDGKSTAGLVNINTASIEVLRTLPHMYKMVHGTPDWEVDDTADYSRGGILDSPNTASSPFDPNPRVAIPEAIVSYRNLQGYPGIGGAGSWQVETGHPFGPDYFTRGIPDANSPAGDTLVRGDRGFAAIGELFNLNKSAVEDFTAHRFEDRYGTNYSSGKHDPAGQDIYLDAWTMDFAANDPFTRDVAQRLRLKSGSDTEAWYDGTLSSDMRAPNPTWASSVQEWGKQFTAPAMLSVGAPLSTDVIGEPSYPNSTSGSNPSFDDAEIYRGGDRVAGDAEEANMLFAGISNMVTTRSDVFTVHFRIRTFVQNPDTKLWDATDRDMIIDDSRYVMLVDRSNVDSPNQSPRILYLQKVSN